MEVLPSPVIRSSTRFAPSANSLARCSTMIFRRSSTTLGSARRHPEQESSGSSKRFRSLNPEATRARIGRGMFSRILPVNRRIVPSAARPISRTRDRYRGGLRQNLRARGNSISFLSFRALRASHLGNRITGPRPTPRIPGSKAENSFTRFRFGVVWESSPRAEKRTRIVSESTSW